MIHGPYNVKYRENSAFFLFIYTLFVFIIYLYAKFYMPGSLSSLIFIFKPQAREIFSPMLLFYILLTVISHFSKLCYHASFLNHDVSGACIAPRTQVARSPLLLLIV